MDAAMKTYKVKLERDEEGWWVAEILGVQGAATQGRSIHEAMERARDVLALALDDDSLAENARLVPEIKLPSHAQKMLKDLNEIRRRLAALTDLAEKSSATTRRVAKELAKEGLSTRDVGELLGLSFQRVHQLIGKRA
jgi:predicted RNase H-like HicB family nuclease